jgi:hypothetical protein
MTFAARYEDPPRVWGVGRVTVPGADGSAVVTPWAVSQADIDDEAASLAPSLAALGLGNDDLVLIASLLSQAIHVVPLEKAAGLVGALYSSADATPFDAFRTASLIRQLHATIVLGIDGAVLDGLADAGRDFGEVFGDVPAVVCVDGATASRLRDAGLTPRGWVTLGPTSAFQGLDDDAFVYDAQRWRVEEDDGGELVITNVASRLTPCDGFRTGVHGIVTGPGRLTLPEFAEAP